MQLDADNNTITYKGDSGTQSIYILTLDGEPTMLVICDTADVDKKIFISDMLGHTLQPTKGQFTMTEQIDTDVDGLPLGVTSRVNEKSVYAYVIPRMHTLLGRLLRAYA